MVSRPILGDRFELLEQLGRGSYGSVYRAIDLADDIPIALKLLHGQARRHVARFKREFRELQDLQHRNIVQQRELLRIGDQWMLCMELVTGHDFLSYLGDLSCGAPGRQTSKAADSRAPARAPEAPQLDATEPPKGGPPQFTEAGLERLRDCVLQLALALQVLHGAGRVHRDLKPQNVRVTAAGRVVVLDFGLVVGATESSRSTKPAYIGTPAFMAPELGQGGVAEPPADMYALGLMIHEALTGTIPGGSNSLNILRERQRLAHASPRGIVAAVPDDLETLCVGLTQLQPGDRLTADAVVASLAGPRAAAPPSPWSPSPSPPPRARQGLTPGGAPGRWPGAVLGRTRELEALQRAADGVRKGHFSCLLVSGPSGIGKTSFMQLCCQRFAELHPDAVILSGRCRHNESIPLRAFDGVLDRLSRHLRGLRTSERRSLVSSRDWAMLNLLPALQGMDEVDPDATDPVDSPSTGVEEAFDAFTGLLEAVADEAPLLVAIDDFHWADAESLKLLEAIVRGPASPAMLLLLTSDRTDSIQAAVAHGLESLCAHRDAVQLELGALAATEAAALALQLQRSANTEQAAQIARAAACHPMWVDALARAALPGQPLPSIASVTTAALEELDAGARTLVELCCSAAQPLDKRVLQQASGLGPEAFAGHLFALCGMRWLRLRNNSPLEPSVEPYLPELAQSVVGQLSDSRREKLSEDLAAADR
ncbi:MAG: serine/threonine-protein kinase [Myxococcales bacterium]|nr:serine/threonine-protein kinase [Myxococcales bacterium]